jgi:hypothetical protein
MSCAGCWKGKFKYKLNEMWGVFSEEKKGNTVLIILFSTMQLLQNDPAYAPMTSTSNQTDFSYTPALPTLV